MTENKVSTRWSDRPGARWFVVVGALIIQLCLGSIYAYGAFAKPLKAYFPDNTDIENQLPFAFGLLFFALVMAFFAGKWQDRVGPRKVAFTGGIVLGLGLILSGLVDSMPALYITYGVIGGSGIGLAYVCPIAALVKWFPDKKGLISGIAVAGFGAGALIFATLGNFVMTADLEDYQTDFLEMKPDDIEADGYEIDETRTTLTGLEEHILELDYTRDFKDKRLEFDNRTVTLTSLKGNTTLEYSKYLSEEELTLLVSDPASLDIENVTKREKALKDAKKAIRVAAFMQDKTDLTGMEIHILMLGYEGQFEDNSLVMNNFTITLTMLKEQTNLEDAKKLDDTDLELLVADPATLSDDEKKKDREEAFEEAQKAILAAAKNDIYDDFNWQKAFMVLGAIFLVCVVLGSFLLANPPEGWLPQGWTPPVQKTATGETAKADYHWQEMIKTPTFLLIWGMFLLAATSGLMTIGNIGKFAAARDIGPDKIALIAVGFLSLANGAGRIGWGAISDMIGRTKALFFMYIIQAVTMFLLYSMGGSVVTLAIGAILVGFCFGGNFAMFPSATADFFGIKNVGQNYGIVFTAYGIAGIFGAIIAGKLVEDKGVEAYLLVFTIMGVFSLIAAFMSLITKAPHEKPGLEGLFKTDDPEKNKDDLPEKTKE